MSLHLKLFSTTAEYDAYTADTSNFILPNVSYCKDNDGVHYNPEPPSDPRLIAVYDVTSTSESTPLYCGSFEGFTSMEVDDVELPEVTNLYTFSTTGRHTVKYTLSSQTFNCFSIICCYPGPIDVIIPDSVTSIGYGAFQDSSLTSCTIGNGVVTICDDAFRGCSELESIDIPNNVTSIGDRAFTRCNAFTDVVIPSSVTSIGTMAFAYCGSLTSIVIPNSVTNIGDIAFEGTPWWSNYSADDSHHYGNIIYINDVAYKATSTSITSATFKSGTISIGGGAFEKCSGLTSIDIPNSVTSIGGGAFEKCSGLTSIVIPNSVTSIGDSAFHYCTGLASIDIPNSVTSIDDGVFESCSGLTSINIPDGVTSIGGSAFGYCSGLTSINIPDSVTSIGGGAFYYCGGLTSVTVNAITPPILGGSYVFASNASGRKIYVPSASVEAYKAADGWSDYAADILPIQ